MIYMNENHFWLITLEWGAFKKWSNLLPVEESSSNFSLYRRVPASGTAGRNLASGQEPFAYSTVGSGNVRKEEWTQGGRWRGGDVQGREAPREKRWGGEGQRGDSRAREEGNPSFVSVLGTFQITQLFLNSSTSRKNLNIDTRNQLYNWGMKKTTKSTRIWIQCPSKHILSLTWIWDPCHPSNGCGPESLFMLPVQRLGKDPMSRQTLDLV